MATIGTLNEEGTNVDLYIPRKCHATNTLITSYDHSAVQIAIANVNASGVIDGTTTTFCIAGYLRAQGDSDHAINRLAIDRGIVRIKTGKPPRNQKTRKIKSKAKGVHASATSATTHKAGGKAAAATSASTASHTARPRPARGGKAAAGGSARTAGSARGARTTGGASRGGRGAASAGQRQQQRGTAPRRGRA